MPVAAGILDIISGALSFFMAVVWLLVAAMTASDSQERLCLNLLGVSVVAGILAIVGGIFALNRKKWGLALAGSIAALYPMLLPGIAAIVLTAQSKKEF